VRHLMYLRNVATLVLDRGKCIGCGMCATVCPHTVFAASNGKVEIHDKDACMECGACAKNCPAEAITVRAGVGCAEAIINAALGRKSSSCCCVIEPEGSLRPSYDQRGGKSGCC
jgi:NAD-dependent dihydropyrimidine dehydrogenase PreA subunit